ncbi:uncharacterized protein C8Q71DRAFT_31625 [Rhodofomes roseus]|uniref:C2H2-type domain-containing protein n=1 Tax=Rhodofomes roseus TaxID=34475 RepID=A0ABQ8KZ41_9APHY|nr:uncharacterized protein C8Q71DRAFT_31625 [Rhodofomes roseus]KAH9844135.1 hypothetical protein C8Q71DRAFT_31625 [Rhodofomes roseus]
MDVLRLKAALGINMQSRSLSSTLSTLPATLGLKCLGVNLNTPAMISPTGKQYLCSRQTLFRYPLRHTAPAPATFSPKFNRVRGRTETGRMMSQETRSIGEHLLRSRLAPTPVLNLVSVLHRRSPGQYVQSWLAEDVSLSPSVRDYPCAIAPPLSANIPRSDADALTAHSGNQTVALCPTTAATASRAASPLALSPSYPIQQTWQPAPGTYYASPHVYQPPPPPAYAPQALPPPPPTYAPPPPPQNAPAQLVPADLQLDRAIEDPICGLEGCSIRLDDLTVGGQRRHLRDFHAAELQHGRVQCTWVYDSGTMCGRDLDKNNWGKHIAAVHYGSTAEQCPYCPKVICRPDALRRHVDNFHSRADED